MLPMIRKAIRKDIPAIYALVCELAEYERLRKEVYATVESYLEDFDNGWFNALVAESNGQIIGITIYYKTFSTWKGKMIYLEDFIVTESERGKGVGKLLFEAFLDESKRLGANLVGTVTVLFSAVLLSLKVQHEPDPGDSKLIENKNPACLWPHLSLKLVQA